MRLNDLVERDLQTLQETDLMGPWTRAEYNRRKLAAKDPSAGQEQEPKKYDFTTLDRMLSERMAKIRENGE